MDRTSHSGSETEYWVIFRQGVTHWITRWLRPNFSHILVVTRDRYNWILLNPTRLYLQIAIPPVSPSEPLPVPYGWGPDDTVVRMTIAARDDTQQYGTFGPLNCVTWAKYVLGLRVWSFTPYQLFRKLVGLSADRARMEAHGITSIERIQG